MDFHHYDFYGQALAKIERGHELDLQDVAAMRRRGLIEAQQLAAFFTAIEGDLLRFPGIDASAFASQLRHALETTS